jgi:4-amino-4-deoxy-L-arabinose transferase-like glycosyltransferase
VALFLICLGALILRLWYIGFELPNIYTGFEQHEVMRAVRLGMGNFDFERIGKGGYFYLLFVEYGVFFVVLKLMGIVQSAQDFAVYFLRDPSPFWIIGRVTTAVIGTISVALTYILGKKLFDWRVGLMAALFLAINPLHIKYSHYAGVDVPMVMLAIVTLYMMMVLLETGRVKHYLLAGLLVGLAATTKFSGILLALPLLLAHGLRIRDERAERSAWLDRRLWLALLAMVGIYIVANPGVIVTFSSFLGMVKGLLFAKHAVDESDLLVEATRRPNLWLFYLKQLSQALGIPLLVAVALGFLRACWKPTHGEKLILLFCVTLYVAVSTSQFEEWRGRYVLPLVPFGVILAARFLSEVGRHCACREYAARAVLGALVLLTAVPVGALGVAQAQAFGRPDVRTLAKRWVETHIPTGARILLHGDPILTTKRIVQIQNLPENLLALAKQQQTNVSGKVTYLTKRAMAQQGPAYDLVAFDFRQAVWEPLDSYRAQGIEYLILYTEVFDGPDALEEQGLRSKSRRRFYRELQQDAGVRLLTRFDPAALHGHGPHIEIYDIREQ